MVSFIFKAVDKVIHLYQFIDTYSKISFRTFGLKMKFNQTLNEIKCEISEELLRKFYYNQ
jgi:hypothetical protein